MKLSRLWATAVCMSVLGCNSPGPRLNAPPHGPAEETSSLQPLYTHMTDNALLADMSINDSHFLPDRPRLNSLGEQRLGRLAALMQEYGGDIRFDSASGDEKLIERRIEAIRNFLAEAGIQTTADTVRRDLPGGDGMDATEAILIKANEGTYAPGAKEAQIPPTRE